MCLQVEFGGQTMAFETAPGLFSPARADRGTLAMLGVAALQPGLRVLDLGCGWGLAGVYAALICGAENVVMTDIDPRAAPASTHKNKRFVIFVWTGFRVPRLTEGARATKIDRKIAYAHT